MVKVNPIHSKSKRGEYYEFYETGEIEECVIRYRKLLRLNGDYDTYKMFRELTNDYRKNKCSKCLRLRKARITLTKKYPYFMFEQFPVSRSRWTCDPCKKIMSGSVSESSIDFFRSLSIASSIKG